VLLFGGRMLNMVNNIIVSHVPVPTAARVLQVSKARVYQMISENKLRFIEMDGTYLIDYQDLERFQIVKNLRAESCKIINIFEGQV
jgi:excisionase family DNA binding protein